MSSKHFMKLGLRSYIFLISNTMFALHNGVTFGYDETFDPRMIKDAQDIYRIHRVKKKEKAQVFKLKLIKGSKDETVKV